MVPFWCFPTGYEIEDGLGVTERILRVIERIVENLNNQHQDKNKDQSGVKI